MMNDEIKMKLIEIELKSLRTREEKLTNLARDLYACNANVGGCDECICRNGDDGCIMRFQERMSNLGIVGNGFPVFNVNEILKDLD